MTLRCILVTPSEFGCGILTANQVEILHTGFEGMDKLASVFWDNQ